MAPALKVRKKRVPKLTFTTVQKIGWHVSYRDPQTGMPKKHRLGVKDRTGENRARALYHAWVAKHLGIDTGLPTNDRKPPALNPKNVKVRSGSLVEIGSALIDAEHARVRKEGDPRTRGTIAPRVVHDREIHVRDFLVFLNSRQGDGAVTKMRLADLKMEDVEAYNQFIAGKGYSVSMVSKRMRIIRALIDRAGRPEHGLQVLSWNWNSRDRAHGKPSKERTLPTKKQLVKLLKVADPRGKTMIWLGIGLGFGPHDLSSIRVGQISKVAYDLRRGKTGIERYGTTPPLVWALLSAYQKSEKRKPGELLFHTRNGEPLVHGLANNVIRWWDALRESIGEDRKSVSGFYTLRHLGATEFGSRPRASIGGVKRWLGHAASSNVADVYMRPVRPEYHEVVQWVRTSLARTKLVLPKS